MKSFDHISLAIILAIFYLGGDALNYCLREERILDFRRVYQMRQLTSDALISLLNVETGARGYLITHNKAFLDPMLLGKQTAVRQLNDLSNLVESSPQNQRNIVQEFKRLANKKIALATEHVALAPTNKVEIIKYCLAGKQIMDDYRIMIARLTVLEDAEIAKRREENTKIRLFELIVRIFIMLFLVMLIWPRKQPRWQIKRSTKI